MDDNIQNNELQNIKLENIPTPVKKKSSIGKTILLIIIALVLMSGSALGAFYLRDSQAAKIEKQQSDDIANYKKTIAAFEEQTMSTINSTDTNNPELCAEVAPDITAVENIKASITSGNTAALEGYMASGVNVILAASEASGVQAPAQAISRVSDFISSDINSWDYDFSLPSTTTNTYKQGSYSQYFTDSSLVGKATNEKLISFSFNCLGKIDTVFLANDANLL